MPHLLAKLRGVRIEDIGKILRADASKHAEQGLYLEHLWQNADDSEEVLFLFRTKDLSHAKIFIDKVHTQALKENPNANLPQMTFLEEDSKL
jgi:hypothetical protein